LSSLAPMTARQLAASNKFRDYEGNSEKPPSEAKDFTPRQYPDVG